MAKVRNILHRSLAGFMALWLSGIVFLFCCPEMKAAAAEDSCPLVKAGSHCDKTAKPQTTSDVVEGVKPACLECCAFLPVVFDKSRKIDLVKKQIAAPAEETAVKAFRLPEMKTPADIPVKFIERIPDRGGTYVRNCVFRI